MVLVKCDMCDEMHELSDFPDGQIFICLICAHVLSRIKKTEIKVNQKLPKFLQLKMFDRLREIYGTPANRQKLQEKYNKRG